jgi:hypothetical protein
MKKVFSIILCLVLLFSLTSCGSIKRIEPFVWGFSNHNIDNYDTVLKDCRTIMPNITFCNDKEIFEI